MNLRLKTEPIRLVRIFVSSPDDVADERRLLDEVVDRINRTMGARSVRVEVASWERDIVPQIGPPPQDVVNDQTRPFAILLGIMANRFGTPTALWGSGTEEEFRRAYDQWGALGAPWILFYFNRTPVDPDTIDPHQFALVKRFREELATKGLYASYVGVRGSPEAFFEKVEIHLRQLLERHVLPESVPPSAEPNGDPSVPDAYARWLQTQCSEIELLGLRFKQGYAVRLNTVYVPLMTSSLRKTTRRAVAADELADLSSQEQKPQLLLDLLADRSLYIAGPPGSGKSTFCRWVAWLTCHGNIPRHPVSAAPDYGERFPAYLQSKLPVLVRLREFWSALSALPPARDCSQAELERTLTDWIMAKQPTGLSPKIFQLHLARGSAVLIFDGVDEVPLTRGLGRDAWHPRSLLLSGLAAAIPKWIEEGNRVVVSSRPYGLPDVDVRRLGLDYSPIEPLSEELQALLVRRWFHVLATDAAGVEATAVDLLAHVREHEWLAPLRTSPMLLTAMCVVYSEGKRLPQDRHELYTRIIDNVLHNRFPGDSAVLEAVRNRLSVVAHGMHTGTGLGELRDTPEAEATYSEVDRMIQAYRDESAFTESGFVGAVEAREQLLSQTGLLVPLESERAGFYHLSIQEFLAAQRIVDLDGDRLAEVFRLRASRSEWRNTLSFVFSTLLARYTSRERSVRLLDSLIDACDGATLGLAVVVGECSEILLGRGIRLRSSSEARFRELCLQAIDRNVPVRERWLLGMALGRVGDPRMFVDMQNDAVWVQIPPGEYRIGESRRIFALQRPFWIARWPVTNAQYARFVDQGGYRPTQRWWSQEARDWLLEEGAKEPRFWRSGRWNVPNQPVVGVSYWEAEAFSAWAGGRLPREVEWESAARGPEGLEYPWGDQWEELICNSREMGLNVTSPVGLFPKSRSRSFGLDDMAGNVWEWCQDVIGHDDAAASQRLLRGCSWHDEPWTSRSQNRGRLLPHGRLDHIGFRVVLDHAP